MRTSRSAAISLTLVLLWALWTGASASGPPDAAASGPADPAELFATHCAGCHDGSDSHAPTQEALSRRSPKAILDALTAGSMRYQGLSLGGAERRELAEFLSGRSLRGTVTGATLGRCGRSSVASDLMASPRWSGWSPTTDNTHFQPAKAAGLDANQVPHLSLKWAFGFPDTASAWAQPSISGGHLFVGSQNGTVYSLDARTGCIEWTFEANAGVRASLSIGRRSDAAARTRGRQFAVFFADQQGYVYSVDATTGTLIWSRKVEEHPLGRLTGSPVLYDGRLYVPTSSYEEGGRPPGYPCCTFRGAVIALDASSGDVIWKTFTIPDPPKLLRAYADGTELWGPSGGAIWSAPTIDPRRGVLYVGVGNGYSGPPQPTTDAVVALDLTTGAMRWARQLPATRPDIFGCRPGEVNCGDRPGQDLDVGASPILVTIGPAGAGGAGRALIVVGQKSGLAYALDPTNKGRIVWRYRAGGGSGLGGIQWGIAADDEQAYFPVADIYSDEPGGLHAVKLATGARAWHMPPPPPACGKPSRACSGAQFSAVTVIPGIVFSPSNDGVVRAYSTKDGQIVWAFDTNREFDTVNGVRARGGSMSGPAPVVAGGMMYISSGYGAFGLRPGNVLLAFGID